MMGDAATDPHVKPSPPQPFFAWPKRSPFSQAILNTLFFNKIEVKQTI
jgi:hypothetical protein